MTSPIKMVLSKIQLKTHQEIPDGKSKGPSMIPQKKTEAAFFSNLRFFWIGIHPRYIHALNYQVNVSEWDQVPITILDTSHSPKWIFTYIPTYQQIIWSKLKHDLQHDFCLLGLFPSKKLRLFHRGIESKIFQTSKPPWLWVKKSGDFFQDYTPVN